ncbi:oxalate-binding protein [Anaeramoeba flamelloides]|uniref:Oxalate-binding protein n=1 Tax=Anaeramoeba flamelloides TaxID=1746091 RepID=A0ABQ8YX94_9EUKA|nr:oxalate-binding protein [Anaeramoeba flamelloides]
MKNLFFFFLCLIALQQISCRNCFLGSKPTEQVTVVSISALLSDPSKYEGLTLSISDAKLSMILSSQWMALTPSDDPGVLMATPNTKFFSWPEGLFERYSIPSLIGTVAFNNFSTSAYLDSQPEIIFNTEYIEIDTGSETCTKWSNQIITQDLSIHGIYNGNMGGGIVCLEPGQDEPLHSTHVVTEVLTVYEGCVELKIQRNVEDQMEMHLICKGHAGMVPPGTPHMVHNSLDVQACYVYVWSLVNNDYQ